MVLRVEVGGYRGTACYGGRYRYWTSLARLFGMDWCGYSQAMLPEISERLLVEELEDEEDEAQTSCLFDSRGLSHIIGGP